MSETPSNPSGAHLLRIMGEALLAAAIQIEMLDAGTPTATEPDALKERPPGKVTHRIRMGLQFRALSPVDNAGGMSEADFVAMGKTTGYGRGFAQLTRPHGSHEPLCLVKDGWVTLSAHGKEQLADAKAYWGIQ